MIKNRVYKSRSLRQADQVPLNRRREAERKISAKA